MIHIEKCVPFQKSHSHTGTIVNATNHTLNSAFEHCSRAGRISPHLSNSAQHNLFSSYMTLENICSLLGIVVGITVESQTIAALVNISKYNILSTVPGQIEFPLISPIVLSTIVFIL